MIKETEQKIRALKEARGLEFQKGKADRDDNLIERCHKGINKLKAIAKEQY